MDSDSVVTLEKLQNKLNSIEAKIDQNFKDIGSQLKEHTRALAFISQTLGKTDLAGKSPKNTSASPANADEMIADTRTQYEKIREELSNRVGVLEKWRWVIIGGSIVVGFIITKLPIWS